MYASVIIFTYSVVEMSQYVMFVILFSVAHVLSCVMKPREMDLGRSYTYCHLSFQALPYFLCLPSLSARRFEGVSPDEYVCGTRGFSPRLI
jgi:hypothetical protein